MKVYLGEPGYPKPRIVRGPDEYVLDEWLVMIGARKRVDRPLSLDVEQEAGAAACAG